MGKFIIPLLTTLVNLLTPDLLRTFIDSGLDAVESAVAATPNKYDDAIILPLCSIVRTVTNTPDED